MDEFNLFEFVTERRLGPLHCNMTRADVERILGTPTRDTYPDVAEYGHIGFDFGPNTCSIQILFPHETLRIDNPTIEYSWWNTWPDPKYKWDLWELKPGVEFETMEKLLPDFSESEWIQPNPRLRGLSNDQNWVEILFEQEYDSDVHTIKLIAAFPMNLAG